MTDAQKEMEIATIHAFREAWLFEQVAKLLSDKQSKESATAATPFVVNCAFSLEVYFKCLYMIEQKRYHTNEHDLQTLYNDLNQESQAEIVKLYAQGVAKEPEWARLPFATVLDWAKNAFKEWRYNYERWRHQDIESHVFANGEILCGAVRERIIQLKSDWTSFLRNDFA